MIERMIGAARLDSATYEEVEAVRQALDYTSTWRAVFVVILAAIPSIVLTGVVVALTGGVDGAS